MRSLWTFGVFLLLYFNASSQSMNLQIPKAGDKTYFCPIEEFSERFVFTSYNSDSWDYSRLNPTYIKDEYFTGYNYEIGDIKCDLVYHKLEGEKEFFIKNKNGLTLVGIISKSDYTISEKAVFKVLGNPVTLKSSVTVGESISSEYKLVALFGKKELNLEMNFLPQKTDSIRIEISINKTSAVKDIGTLNLYNLDQKASLIESISRYQIKIFVKYTHDHKWFEYNFNKTKLPNDLAYFASKKSLKTYEYYTKQTILPVLKYKVIQNAVELVFIQDKLNVYNIPVIDDKNKTLIAYPNPAIENITFNLINYPRSSYRLEISNILGNKIKSITINPNDNNQIKLDISDLYNGIYLYKFIDGVGRKSPTQRFIKTSI